MGEEAGSADLVIDETNQATGKRVFPRFPWALLRRVFLSCNERDPDSSPIPTSKRPLGADSSSHCTARGVQNEGTGEFPNCSSRRILSQRRVPQMIITQRKGATWADVHGAPPAARLGDAVGLPLRISTGHKRKQNGIPLGRLLLLSLLFLLQGAHFFCAAMVRSVDCWWW